MILSVMLEISTSFYWGILASAIVAVGALFVFFLLLRPRIKIMPIIAYRNNTDSSKGSICEIAFVNKGLFSCNDIKIQVSLVGKDKNDTEQDKPLVKCDFLTIGSRLKNENESVHVIRFALPQKGFPGMMRVSVLAKHSVSSVEYGHEHIFCVTDFCEGGYEKGVFVQEGNTYKQAVMRKNTRALKWFLPIFILISAVVTCLLSIYLHLSWMKIIVLLTMCMSLLITVLIIWQCYIHAKADAYSTTIAHHVIERIMIGVIKQNSDEPQPEHNVEEVQAIEIHDDSN